MSQGLGPRPGRWSMPIAPGLLLAMLPQASYAFPASVAVLCPAPIPHFADEYVSSSRSLGLPIAASSEGHRLPGHGPAPSSVSGVSTQPPLHLPTKLVIRHGGAGGSPSVTWARASSSLSSSAASSLDADEDGPMPSRNRPPIKTYEARSRIGLKLKIKQEAGLSKVVHNTALDPVHQPPPPAALKAAEPPPRPPRATPCHGPDERHSGPPTACHH